MSTEHSQPESEWTSCPSGTLQGLSARLKTERRAEQLWKGSAATSLLLLVGMGVWFFTRPAGMAPGVTIAGLTCQEVHGLLPEYAAKQTDQELTERITLHLEGCPMCVKALDELRTAGEPQARACRSSVCPHRGGRHGGFSLASVERSLAALIVR